MTTPHSTPVIDIEASGFGLESFPIEIGLVLPNGAIYCALIKPHSSWTHWDKRAEKIHGITRYEINNHGKDIASVCDDLNALCDGQVLYTDCWSHDYHWLCRLYAAAGKHCSFRLSPIEYLLSEQQMQTWAQRKKDYALQSDIKTHRALNDALIIAEALDRELLMTGSRIDNLKLAQSASRKNNTASTIAQEEIYSRSTKSMNKLDLLHTSHYKKIA